MMGSMSRPGEHSGHRERLRRRYLNEGLDAFEPHEILELLLYYAIPRRDCNETAHKLMNEFKSISNVLEADVSRLSRIEGMGEISAVLLNMIPALSRIYMQDKWSTENKDMLSTFDCIGQYAINMFMGKQREEFAIICLDSNRRIHFAGTVLKGTINETPAYPRLIVDEALKHNAQTIVLAHNHPSGSILPSDADLHSTTAIVAALEAIAIDVLDHVIVSGQRYYSMGAMGHL